MKSDTANAVADCADLSSGDRVQAWRKGRLIHKGLVTDILPAMKLFWIEEEPFRERRLLDFNEFDVVLATRQRK